MKKHLCLAPILSCIVSGYALAEPPENANNAVNLKPQSCSFLLIVDPDEAGGILPVLPGGYGVLYTNLEADNGKITVTNSGNGSISGNIHQNCKSSFEWGAFYEGTNLLNPSGPTVTGKASPYEEACNATNLAGLGVCKGDGTFVNRGGGDPLIPCIMGGAIPTNEWHQTTTKSGKMSMNCH